jgi:hypothetical protein
MTLTERPRIVCRIPIGIASGVKYLPGLNGAIDIENRVRDIAKEIIGILYCLLFLFSPLFSPSFYPGNNKVV